MREQKRSFISNQEGRHSKQILRKPLKTHPPNKPNPTKIRKRSSTNSKRKAPINKQKKSSTTRKRRKTKAKKTQNCGIL